MRAHRARIRNAEADRKNVRDRAGVAVARLEPLENGKVKAVEIDPSGNPLRIISSTYGSEESARAGALAAVEAKRAAEAAAAAAAAAAARAAAEAAQRAELEALTAKLAGEAAPAPVEPAAGE